MSATNYCLSPPKSAKTISVAAAHRLTAGAKQVVTARPAVPRVLFFEGRLDFSAYVTAAWACSEVRISAHLLPLACNAIRATTRAQGLASVDGWAEQVVTENSMHYSGGKTPLMYSFLRLSASAHSLSIPGRSSTSSLTQEMWPIVRRAAQRRRGFSVETPSR